LAINAGKETMTAIQLENAIEFLKNNIKPGMTYRFSSLHQSAILLQYTFSSGSLSAALNKLVQERYLSSPERGVYLCAGGDTTKHIKKEKVCIMLLNEIMQINFEYRFKHLWDELLKRNIDFSVSVLANALITLQISKKVARPRFGVYVRINRREF
jgi:hypothetical protein